MPADFWLGILILAVVSNAMLRLRLFREIQEMERKTTLVLNALVVWAEHWGEPPDEVRPLLLKALRR